MQTSLSREQRQPEACEKQNESLGLPSAHLISLEIPNSNPSSSTVGGSSSSLMSFTVLSKEGVIKQIVLFTEHQLYINCEKLQDTLQYSLLSSGTLDLFYS